MSVCSETFDDDGRTIEKHDGQALGANRALMAICLAEFGAMICFYLLFPVVPLYALSKGAGEASAGLVTGTLMVSTVAMELAMPHLSARVGYRRLLAGGLLLLGMPALLLCVASGMAMILAVSLLRGLGLGIVMVAGSTLVAAVVPPARRGEALGLYGAASGVPAVGALSLGPWLAGEIGYMPLFAIGAVAALAGLAGIAELPGGIDRPIVTRGGMGCHMKAGVLHPCAVLMAVAMMAGVVTTFLPIVFAPVPGTVLSLSLLLHALAAIATRWLAGRLAKPLGQARWLSLGALAAVLGITAIAAFDGPPASVAGMILIGAGFGIVQNTSLTLLFARVPASNFPAVSALWNLSYDTGLGVGAALFGLLFGAIGHQLALALFGALVLAALCLRPEAK